MQAATAGQHPLTCYGTGKKGSSKSMDLYLEQHPFNGKQNCKDADPELFFPDDNGVYMDLERAKGICRSCPLTVDCLSYALKHPELEGVWGGTTVKDRKQLRRRRPRVTTGS